MSELIASSLRAQLDFGIEREREIERDRERERDEALLADNNLPTTLNALTDHMI